MSFNGSGTFVINSTGQPVVANTVISATVFNALTADLASGLTNCITKDGQSTPTANIPMGSNKITGLANGTLIGDAANLGQVQSTVAKLISITGTDTVLGTMSPTLTAYAAGQLFYFVAGGANTGAVTLNVDGLGAKAITRDGSTALAAGDINSGEIVVVIYDGTRFQMINAANSFGNTTINGTLTVTGNTGLQANVSVTSALSVGGTFAVTGAATLGSTLAVTGKSDLPTVSTASANAAVAVITDLSAAGASITSANVGTAVVTTGTVTNLTATSASVASVNAGVALLTTATVTNLTATGASIASANLGNAVISALTLTGVSVASANFGVAVVTDLRAVGASVTSANLGTAVVTNGTVTNLTATSASVASVNAAVALLTTATVTTLTASGASIASANIGNLQFTAASIASINAGVAVINNLTATSASIASANVGTAVITTGTVTNLTSTAASVASANVGVALITTGTVTSLTATGASVASANVGTAVVTGLTVTGASIASMNGVTANITTVNATTVDATNVEVTNVKAKDGTAAITIADSTGYVSTNNRVGFGSSSLGIYTVRNSLAISGGTTAHGYFTNSTVASDVTSTANGFFSQLSTAAASFTLTNLRHYYATGGTIGAGSTVTAQAGFFADNGLTGATNNYGFYGNIASGTGRYNVYMAGTADNYFAGNVGIGTASPTAKLHVVSGTGAMSNFVGNNSNNYIQVSDDNASNYVSLGAIGGGNAYLYSGSGKYTAIYSGAAERMRIDSSGNVGIGGTAAASARANVLGTLPSSGGFSSNYLATGSIPSSTTGRAEGYTSFFTTAAASFTVNDLVHFFATAPAKGAGSTITNQFGFLAASSITTGTNNYGFYSEIASGSNRWNFYAAGTAQNYFAGNVGIGRSPSAALDVAGDVFITKGSSPLFCTGDNQVLRIGVNQTEYLRITTGGDVLIGTTTSGNGRLEVSQSANNEDVARFFSAGSGDVGQRAILVSKYDNNSTTSQIFVQFAINNNATTSGQINANGANAAAFGTWSDERLKENIVDLPPQLANICALRPVEFDYKTGGHQIGFIAQDMQKVYADTVGEGTDGMLTVTGWSKTEARLVKAIQELAARVAELEAK